MEPLRLLKVLPLPENVLKLNYLFKQNGYELYVVGGAIRDFLLNSKIKDYDLATNALPDEIEKILNDSKINNIGTGKSFGVINAFIDSEEYEIATFRNDNGHYSDGRRPDSVTFTTIENDVLRRDLTMNALFYDIEKNEIVDYVGGVSDIENGIVRTVGEPTERFNEDSLRIMRAIRFANRTGNKLDNKIDDYLRRGYNLFGISKERVRDEFIKSIKSALSVKELMGMYLEYDMLNDILPYLLTNGQFIDENDHILVISNLLKNNPPTADIARVLNKLCYTTDEIKGITFLIDMNGLNVNNFYRLKKRHKNSKLNNKIIIKNGEINGINPILLETFVEFELSVSGEHVMNKFNLSGPSVGTKIEDIETNNFKQRLKNRYEEK